MRARFVISISLRPSLSCWPQRARAPRVCVPGLHASDVSRRCSVSFESPTATGVNVWLVAVGGNGRRLPCIACVRHVRTICPVSTDLINTQAHASRHGPAQRVRARSRCGGPRARARAAPAARTP
ncbi:hypothetical protein PsYK624_073480 [Phanerochaete sordida]|uniref:Uncharacterized protein n=1 Tax=Phanerochaete sordida TaxID=48140 RepID=A0A9P3GB96_9APHY|nr:hypothetical protein PsYK624_073480 [Phanerochaete sordida]